MRRARGWARYVDTRAASSSTDTSATAAALRSRHAPPAALAFLLIDSPSTSESSWRVERIEAALSPMRAREHASR
jgi:hypothetical protein